MILQIDPNKTPYVCKRRLPEPYSFMVSGITSEGKVIKDFVTYANTEENYVLAYNIEDLEEPENDLYYIPKENRTPHRYDCENIYIFFWNEDYRKIID